MKKSLELFDIIAFAFSAIYALDSVSSAAAIGWSSLIYWFLFAILFFIPYGLIVAELGSTYKSGGIYTWIKKAFGSKWGARTNWFYWLNFGLWMSSAYIALSSTFSYAFFTNNPLSLWTQIAIAISITILTILFGFINIKYLKWVPNVSSMGKVVVVIGILAAAIIWLSNGHSVQTSFNDKNYGIMPSWSTGVVFIPVIICHLCGFELGSNAVNDMQNPKRDVPLSILISGLVVVLAYIIAIASMEIITPANKIDISNGVIQTIINIFPSWLTKIFAFLFIVTLFGNMITWSIGTNRAMQEAAKDGEFQKVFATKLKNGAPLGASIINGTICCFLLILAGALSKNGKISDLYWLLYAFSSIVFLLPYLFIFPAYFKLRKIDRNIPKTFKLKDSRIGDFLICFIPLSIIIFTLILFFFGKMLTGEATFSWLSGGRDLTFSMVGTMFSIFIGELLIFLQERKNKKNINDK